MGEVSIETRFWPKASNKDRSQNPTSCRMSRSGCSFSNLDSRPQKRSRTHPAARGDGWSNATSKGWGDRQHQNHGARGRYDIHAKLPLTLAIIDGMTVSVSKGLYRSVALLPIFIDSMPAESIADGRRKGAHPALKYLYPDHASL